MTFDDGESHKSLRYDPEQNTIKIADSILGSDMKNFTSVLGYLMSEINKDKARGAAFEKSQGKVNGTLCTIYHVKNADGTRWKKLAVGVKTRQIVRFEILERGQQQAADIDYSESGPKDIYALGVTRDAKIVDERTRDDQSNVMLANAQSAARQFVTTFRAIVCDGPVDEKSGTIRALSITAYCQTPHQRRVDRWQLSTGEGLLNPENI